MNIHVKPVKYRTRLIKMFKTMVFILLRSCMIFIFLEVSRRKYLKHCWIKRKTARGPPRSNICLSLTESKVFSNNFGLIQSQFLMPAHDKRFLLWQEWKKRLDIVETDAICFRVVKSVNVYF